MNSVKKIVLSALAFVAAGVVFAATIPELTAPVMDTANIIDNATKSDLNAYLMAVSEQTGVQVAVFTISSLDGESIEEFSMKTAEKWQLGQAKEDNGVLLTVAVEDHKLRIEVGYGLEGLLTDTKCGIIIRNAITPQFQDGDFTQGIVNGVLQIVSVATDGAEIATDLQQVDEDEGLDDEVSAGWLAFLIIVIILVRAGILPIFLLFLPFKFASGHSSSGGGHSYHSSHSFHSSGHSFHGGGGHFGGGGASGRW
ncbi:MAG: TPM domain-containing protein [Treponema sp.]|nr:TPM domain-containing protein [Treponema sp.]